MTDYLSASGPATYSPSRISAAGPGGCPTSLPVPTDSERALNRPGPTPSLPGRVRVSASERRGKLFLPRLFNGSYPSQQVIPIKFKCSQAAPGPASVGPDSESESVTVCRQDPRLGGPGQAIRLTRTNSEEIMHDCHGAERHQVQA